MAANPDAPAAALELASGDGALVARLNPHAGMVGCSLRHRGEELLGPAGIPILHPWANRLSGWSSDLARTSFACGLRPPSAMLTHAPRYSAKRMRTSVPPVSAS